MELSNIFKNYANNMKFRPNLGNHQTFPKNTTMYYDKICIKSSFLGKEMTKLEVHFKMLYFLNKRLHHIC